MKNKQHVLISLKELHANNILSGTKQVELRRRVMHVEPGSIVWLYVKKPVGAVVGYAVVGTTYSAKPNSVWRQYGPVSGLSRTEYVNYFEGATVASAMSILSAKRLLRPIPLEELRDAAPGFQPPQFYCRLKVGSSVMSLLDPDGQDKPQKQPKVISSSASNVSVSPQQSRQTAIARRPTEKAA